MVTGIPSISIAFERWISKDKKNGFWKVKTSLQKATGEKKVFVLSFWCSIFLRKYFHTCKVHRSGLRTFAHCIYQCELSSGKRFTSLFIMDVTTKFDKITNVDLFADFGAFLQAVAGSREAMSRPSRISKTRR